MIDVGGGSGGFAITLAKRFPELRLDVLDFPNVCEVGREYAAQAADEIGDRVGFIPGNALEAPFPAGQDAVLMSCKVLGAHSTRSLTGDGGQTELAVTVMPQREGACGICGYRSLTVVICLTLAAPNRQSD